ncbi:hypothetical protein BD779DRAFT_1450612, partial [Infundibulicybe gibba]
SNLESLQKHKAHNRPTFSELLGMLKIEVETYSRVFVVVDALDETDVRVWVPLLRHLRALSRTSLLATSRDIGDIMLELRPDQRLDISVNGGDMRKYIEGRLSGSTGKFGRLLEANLDLREEITTGVMKKADGMYPLAYRIFSWLIYAAQPMTIHDLQYALAVDDGMTAIDTQDLYDEATLTSICVGLVVLRGNTTGFGSKEVVDNSKTVGFVRKFFIL